MTRARTTLRLGLLALCIAPGCSRSELYGRDHCEVEGSIRECADECGTGTRVCRDELWSACAVPVAERSCADACGTGVARCENGEWSACLVAPTEGTCSNDCGIGVDTCEGGERSTCRVPPTERPCSDVCGAGTEACIDGRLLGCVVPRRTTPCSSLCGSGTRVCEGGTETACDAPLPGPPTWAGTARDFLESHPDFELPFENDHSETGLVDAALGDDGKPVYAGGAGTATTSGQANFDGWFRDAPGTNRTTSLELAFAAGGGGSFVYSGSEFFPLDGQLFGNEGRPHNYHFTVELHAVFDYVGGEFLEVEGDDDIWVFINRRLVVDLGGLHEARSARVALDADRGPLGLVPGRRYPVDLFFAERHTVSSSLNLRTSLTAREWCP